ncbi:hypothetical protein BGZ91_007761 [Linnemannia elongata]|uniref:Uncharacterized protein n=1 Tax=Linnemannia elongata AG-77 TaxID=1314771 RepID=A0A197K1I3_9FUNG|nr:hypothetical protein BGZ91_007761 [Linnemannia elongata]KAG0056422.1 hypothetical protein BGZ90_005542 [Linnemannia elongata]OAQ30556.1 hypothetical protein K457DRAFT_124915 [Linnemannia elongata AG-77]
MNSDHDNKAGRTAATKVGGMRVPAHDHSVPVVRKEHDKKHTKDEKEDSEHNNEDERELEKMERFEYEKQTRLAAGERLARMQENQPKNEITNNFRQRENIIVGQPILHNHSKSGAAAQK